MQITLSPYWTKYLEEMVDFEGFASPNEALRHILTAYQQGKIVQGIRDEALKTENADYVEQLPEWTERAMSDLVARVLTRGDGATRRPTPWHLLPPESLEFEPPSDTECDSERQIAEDPATYDSGARRDD